MQVNTALRARPRLLFIVIILLGHAAALHFFSIRIADSRSVRRAQPMALPIRLVLTPLPQKSAQPARVSTREVPRDVATPVQMSADIRLEQPVADRPDWGVEAGRIARQLAETGSGPKVFGQAGEADEPGEPAVPNFFESESPRKAGYVEMLGPGLERRWINSRCYREFGRPPDRIAGTRPDLNPIQCMVGPGSPRSDLFDHLKPDNLKDRD